jgi:hypothetical protein
MQIAMPTPHHVLSLVPLARVILCVVSVTALHFQPPNHQPNKDKQ